MLREREMEGESDRERGAGEGGIDNYIVYNCLSYYFCKKILLERFHNFLRVEV